MRRAASSHPGPGTIAVLDIGTSKICCLIAATDEQGQCVLTGFGHQRSVGVKSGVVVDGAAAERAIRATVAQAERMAGIELQRVAATISCGRLRARRFVARAAVHGGVVTDADLDRVIAGGDAYASRDGRTLLHLGLSGWSVDGVGGARDPRGMAATELAAELSVVTVDEAPLRNLLTAIERCHLDVDRLLPAPVASAHGVTAPEERAAGVLVIDIGGGTASLAGYSEGALVCAEVIPVGGNHLTYDVARALVTSVAEAERIKTLYGTLVKASSDASELISYPVSGEDGPVLYQVTRSQLRSLIEPRVDSLLDLIEERLGEVGCLGLASGRVMLTGGTGQMMGLDHLWMQRFGGDARVARPAPIGGMPAAMCGPSFAGLIGGARAVLSPEPGTMGAAGAHGRPGGYLGRMRRWLGEAF